MELLRNFFESNQAVIYGLYGQLFFTMGVALALQSLKRTRLTLGKHLRFLALFGLIYGLVEWGDAFIPVQATYMSTAVINGFRWFQLTLMIACFAFLLLFGLRTAFRANILQKPTGSWSLLLILLTIALAFSAGESTTPEQRRTVLEIWIRWLIAAPASIASGLGAWRAMHEVREAQMPRISRWLGISAVSLFGYAALNLITPQYRLLLSNWYNSSAFLQLVGIPVQIIRTLVAVGLLYGMVRSLSLFEMETDRLLQEAQQQKLMEARRELEAMERFAIAMGSAREPHHAMTEVLEQVLPFLRCTEGEIAMWESGSATWKLYAQVGQTRGQTHEAGRWVPSPMLTATKDALQTIVHTEHRLSVGIPIMVGDRFLGAATLYGDQPLQVSEQELLVLDSLGTLVGIALENSRLWDEVRRREEVRTEWISRVIAAQEDERRRISLELHDDAIQELVMLCRRLDALEEEAEPLSKALRDGLEDARMETLELIGTLRSFAHALRPPVLDDLGLSASIDRLCSELESRSGIRCKFSVVGTPDRSLHDLEVGIFRIAQESLRNAEKHAKARSLAVELSYLPEMITLRVSDDGQGATMQKSASSGYGLGIVGMQERAALLGGHLSWESRPGQGTTVSVSVPYSVPDHTAKGA